MTYKTILVHVDDAANVEARIELAANLAKAEDAHLIGTAMTGVSRFLFETMSADAGTAGIAPFLDTIRQRTERQLTPFENIARRAGVGSFEKRMTDDEAAGGLSLQARYSDLVIVGQYDPEGNAPSTYADLPEYVTINGGSPVLIVPYTGAFKDTGERALIAWDASMEATKAVHSAIPLLRRAKNVDVVVFNARKDAGVHGEQPGADIGLYLARHNIKVNVIDQSTEVDVGNALLSLAANQNSDLLVMGCYGHSRFREVLLGGPTRTVLQTMTIPVLTAH
ncbi:MAG TPA: universal stress protein [Noviherbaspirillum sp.]|nr:universal stress protein [Noviherbaspirillum sp.]